jgi:hypothetical protein
MKTGKELIKEAKGRFNQWPDLLEKEIVRQNGPSILNMRFNTIQDMIRAIAFHKSPQGSLYWIAAIAEARQR